MTSTRSFDLLIVGGGAAGHAALLAYRDRHPQDHVVLCSAEEDLPYMRPTLSKEYLAGKAGPDDLPLSGPEVYQGVDLQLGVPVAGLDTGASAVALADGGLIHFERCILATGSAPQDLPVPGADDPRVHQLRSLASARELDGAARSASSAIVLGSGFIGCEAAVSLTRRGIGVTMITNEQAPHRGRLGDYAGERVRDWLAEENIDLVAGATVTGITDGSEVTADGRARRADLVLIGGGARPLTGYLDGAGIAASHHRIVVDAGMRTSVPTIWAAGDIALAHNSTAGRRLAVEHWGEAERMGTVAGVRAAGGNDRWAQVPGFWTTIGDRTLKYAAWGDGYDTAHVVEQEGERFTVWYARDSVLVGVLTHESDGDYERGRRLIETKAPLSAALH